MKSGTRKMKFIISSLNLIAALGGIVFIAIGSKLYLIFRDFPKEGPVEEIDKLIIPSIIIIVIGCLVLLVSIFGLYGVIQESRCITVTFSIAASVIVIFVVMAGGAAFFFRGSFADASKEVVNTTSRGVVFINKKTKYLQDLFECCGSNGPDDYAIIVANVKTYPESCACEASHSDCLKNVYQTGCTPKFIKWVLTTFTIVMVTAFIIATTQILSVVFSCIFAFLFALRCVRVNH